MYGGYIYIYVILLRVSEAAFSYVQRHRTPRLSLAMTWHRAPFHAKLHRKTCRLVPAQSSYSIPGIYVAAVVAKFARLFAVLYVQYVQYVQYVEYYNNMCNVRAKF